METTNLALCPCCPVCLEKYLQSTRMYCELSHNSYGDMLVGVGIIHGFALYDSFEEKSPVDKHYQTVPGLISAFYTFQGNRYVRH
jgi:hypothetical protein